MPWSGQRQGISVVRNKRFDLLLALGLSPLSIDYHFTLALLPLALLAD